MYGLPKVHKEVMVGLVQHELVKWLAELLQTVPDLYSSFCVPGSFRFSECIRDSVFVFDGKAAGFV